MKVLIITPSYPPEISGNATTSARIVGGLNAKGNLIKVCTSKEFTGDKCVRQILDFSPDIIHAFHAYKSGVNALKLKRQINKPLVVTLTGTDINEDIFDRDKKSILIEVLKNSDCITVFHDVIAHKTIEMVPEIKDKIQVIGQSVKLKGERCSIRKGLNLNKDDFIIFIAANLRLIKYHYFYLNELVKIHEKHPEVKVVVAGDSIDKAFSIPFLGNIKEFSWIYYSGKIPHEKIKCVFEDINLVLNCSSSEGGMANAVLEAMSLGKPVLASDIDGNRGIIKEGVTGMLFNNEEDFYKKALMLIEDGSLSRKIGNSAKSFIFSNFRLEEEIKGYIRCYNLLSQKSIGL